LNRLEWGKLKANLTPVVFLFFLGVVMVALPFWRVQQAETRLRQEQAQQPAIATLRGKVMGPGNKNVRLVLVVKPDYDQLYSGDVNWQVPLLPKRTTYLVLYIDGDSIIGERSVSSEGRTTTGEIYLPEWVCLPKRR